MPVYKRTKPGGSDTQVQYNDSDAFGGDAGLTYNESTDTLTVTGVVSTPVLTLSGTGTINGLDAVDSTTEDTIEALIFDSDAENITGVWEVQDDVRFNFGNSAEWGIEYDNGVDDQLLFMTAKTASAAITDPMFEILVDTASGGMTADQQVFGVAKGSQASNTALLTLDEDGDLVIAASFTTT